MEPFERESVFWQTDKPEIRVVGRLTYVPTEGSQLRLMGSFDDVAVAFVPVQQKTPRRISGVAGREVTLDGCIVQNVTIDSSGLLRQDFYVPVVLDGTELSATDTLAFDSVTVGFDHLPAWVNENLFNLSIESALPNDLRSATKFIISCDVPPNISEITDDIEVELSHISSVGGDRTTEMRLTQHPRLSLKYDSPRGFLDIITDINGLQDLITLAVDVPTVATQIELRRSDITSQMSSGESIQIPINAYWSNIAEHVRQVKPSSSTVFFGFEHIDGLKAVAKWVTVSRKYRTVLGLLLSIRYSQRLYEENRFSNVISAAETFHRMRFENELMPKVDYRSYRRKLVRLIRTTLGSRSGDWLNKQLEYSNEPRLRQRLIELADYAGTGFVSLVGDVETWARVVTWARNRLTHHDPKQKFDRRPADLDIITQSVYILVLLVLLRECDLGDAVFEGIMRAPRLAILQQQLTEVVSRLTQYLRG